MNIQENKFHSTRKQLMTANPSHGMPNAPFEVRLKTPPI